MTEPGMAGRMNNASSGSRGASRESDVVELKECRSGLGIKIIGGRSVTGLDFGVFVRSVLNGGIASKDGRLRTGDQLLEVNGTSLVGVTNEQAIGYLKTSAKTDSVRLMVARDEAAQKDYKRLIASTSNGVAPRPGTQPPPMPQSLNDSTVSQTGIIADRVNSLEDIEFHVESTGSTTISDTAVTRGPDNARLQSAEWIDSRKRMPSPVSMSSPERPVHYQRNEEPFKDGSIDMSTEGFRPVSNDEVNREPELVLRSGSSERGVSLMDSTHQVPSYKTDTGDTYAMVLPRHKRINEEGIVASEPVVEAMTNSGTYVPKTLGSTMTTTYTNGATTAISPSGSLPVTRQTGSTKSTGGIASFVPINEEQSTNQPAPRKPLPYKDHVFLHDKVSSSLSGRKLPQPGVMSHSLSDSPSPDPGYATVGSMISNVKIGRESHSTSSHSSPEMDSHLPGEVKFLTIHKRKGLGISVIGGTDHAEGPFVYIENIVEESDAFRDGNLRVGDILVSVNGESLNGVKLQDAQAVLTRVRLRSHLKDVRIGYVRGPGINRRSSLRSSQSSLASSSVNPQFGSANSLTRTPSDTPIIGPPRTRTDSNPYSRHTREMEPQGREDEWRKLGSHDSAVHGSESPEDLFSHDRSVGRSMPSADSGVFNPRVSPLMSPEGGMKSSPGQRELLKEAHDGMISSPSSMTSSPGSVRRRLSIDPECKLKVEKLEVALRYLGIEPTEEQQQQLRERLHVDPSGSVIYSEFVRVARELFSFQLDERTMNTTALFYATQVETNDLPPLPQVRSYSSELDAEASEQELKRRISDQAILQHQRLAREAMRKSPGDRSKSTPVHSVAVDRQRQHSHEKDLEYQLERLRREKEEALREVERLKVMYKEKCQDFNIVEQDGRRLRRDVKKMNSEMQAMKKRLHLAEAARKQARSMEMDYEAVIQDLRKEVKDLSEQFAEGSAEDYHRRCAVLQCQLKKAELSKRAYEVSTEKLLKFAQMAHEVLTEAASQGNGSIVIHHERGLGDPLRRGDSVSGNPRPPSYLTRRARQTSATLAKEAQDTVASVKALVDDEPLPYGWEEAFTPDGLKYFINHVSQMTTWIHPVTNVNHSEAPVSLPSHLRETVA